MARMACLGVTKTLQKMRMAYQPLIGRDISRNRQWYLSPDIDFTRIKTKHKFLKAAFSALNVLKFPAPALEFSKGRLKMRGLVF
jgi:hypothetical protein